MRFITLEFLERLVQHVHDSGDSFYSASHKGTIKLTPSRLYQFIAVYLCVQALQNKSKESNKVTDPQRKNLAEASTYFFKKFPDMPQLGTTTAEVFLSKLVMDKDDEQYLSAQFLSVVDSLGQWVAGDEKLFKFAGRSTILRLVPKKPDKLGIWNYELCGRLRDGSSYLLYVRSHILNCALGEGIPVSEVVSNWGDIVKTKGTEGKTILVADCYYLDERGRQQLQEKDVKYICGVQPKRFAQLSEMAAETVKKAGDYVMLYNDDTNELFVHYWFPDITLGKKFSLTSAFTAVKGKTPKGYIPAIDDFAAMFATCDHYNRTMNGQTWPHPRRHGARQLHNFLMTCVILNTKNCWANVQGSNTADIEFETFVTDLADDVYAHAYELFNNE